MTSSLNHTIAGCRDESATSAYLVAPDGHLLGLTIRRYVTDG